MNKAPESYLNCKRPEIQEAMHLESPDGNMTIGEAIESLKKKGYFAPRPRPWKLGFRDRGMGRGDFAVIDCFGDLVAEVESQADAELIISAVNSNKDGKE